MSKKGSHFSSDVNSIVDNLVESLPIVPETQCFGVVSQESAYYPHGSHFSSDVNSQVDNLVESLPIITETQCFDAVSQESVYYPHGSHFSPDVNSQVDNLVDSLPLVQENQCVGAVRQDSAYYPHGSHFSSDFNSQVDNLVESLPIITETQCFDAVSQDSVYYPHGSHFSSDINSQVHTLVESLPIVQETQCVGAVRQDSAYYPHGSHFSSDVNSQVHNLVESLPIVPENQCFDALSQESAYYPHGSHFSSDVNLKEDYLVIQLSPEGIYPEEIVPGVNEIVDITLNFSNISDDSSVITQQQRNSRGHVTIVEPSGSESFIEDSDDSVADPDFRVGPFINRDSLEEKDNSYESQNIADEGFEGRSFDQDVPEGEVKQAASVLQSSSTSRLNKLLKQKHKHPILPVMCKNCHRQCGDFSSKDRIIIWNAYWSMNYVDRRKWLRKCIQVKPAKRQKPGSTKRKITRMFTLQKDNEDIAVCRNFLLRTLGYTSDTVITALVKVLNQNDLTMAVRENRGGNRRAPIDTNTIKAHIMSYHPAVDNYRRYNNPLTKYLPRHLTLEDMFADFNHKHPNVCKRETYRKVMKKMHICFKTSISDECSDCLHYKDLLSLTISRKENKGIKTEIERHKQKAIAATNAYNKDKLITLDDTLIVSVDLQKVMLIPMMPSIKEAFFTSRLVVSNLTFAPLKATKGTLNNSYCILWHEAMSGRDGSDIVNAFLAFIKENRHVKHFVFWADNCTAQNKNYILYTALVTIVNQNEGPESITLKYLNKEHTHMTADGVHSNIESKIRKVRKINDFDDMVETIKNSRHNLDVVVMSEKYKWEKKARLRKRNDPLKKFCIDVLLCARFEKGSRLLWFKTEFSQYNYRSIDFLIEKYNVSQMPQSIAANRGINKDKKLVILQKLVPLMPTSRQSFWRNLDEAENASDLVSTGFMESEKSHL